MGTFHFCHVFLLVSVAFIACIIIIPVENSKTVRETQSLRKEKKNKNKTKLKQNQTKTQPNQTKHQPTTTNKLYVVLQLKEKRKHYLPHFGRKRCSLPGQPNQPATEATAKAKRRWAAQWRQPPLCHLLLWSALALFLLHGWFEQESKIWRWAAEGNRLVWSSVSIGEQSNCYLQLAVCLKTNLFLLLECVNLRIFKT